MVLPMGKSKLKKALKEMDCADEQAAWYLGEKLIDDDVTRIEALGDQFPDGIPRLRATESLLMLNPGDDSGVFFFENTRGNRRQLIQQILVQLPESSPNSEDETNEEDKFYPDPEPDYYEDLDRPVEPERKSRYRYAS